MLLKLKSMRARATAGFVLIIAAILASIITTMISFSTRSAEAESQQTLDNVAEKSRDMIRLAKTLDPKVWEANLVANLRAPENADKHIVLMVVSRHPDAVVWKSEPNTPAWPPPPRNERRESNWSFSGRRLDSGRPGDPPHPGEFAHGASVIVARPMTGVRKDQAARKTDMLLLAGFIVFAVGVGGWLVVGKTLSPIRKLASQAANASAENLNLRLEPPSNDSEVVELVDTLNGLLGRVSETAESKGRFYAAASHELRTPLQALSGHLELALSRERKAEDYRAALEEARTQSSRLKSLVQSLLLLHQLEGSSIQDREQVDLDSVCDRILGQLSHTIADRALKLSSNVSAVTISATPNHAEILIRNLLENAVKYASSGGLVSVALSAENGVTQLEVFDECEPVPGWNPEKVFEPFYRPDAARTSKTGGNGLGLAICRAIASANDWILTVAQESGGFRTRVIFEQAESHGPKSVKRAERKPSGSRVIPESQPG